MSHLTESPIDLARLIARVRAPGRGAIASFLGVVRNHQENRRVERLEYSAYAPMAERECERIVAEAGERWDAAVALEHRIGRLEIGDTAVAVVAAAAHREPAFAACRFVIEEVKRRVPIWKREHYGDGAVAWVDPTASGGARAPADPSPRPA